MQTPPKQALEGLNLFLENAVDQLSRAQRAAHDVDTGVAELQGRIDQLLGDAVGLRNEIRDALMRELARGPRKLPIV